MSALLILACLHGPCVLHGHVMQIPAPWIHPGKSEAGYEVMQYLGMTWIFVPMGASI